MKYEVIPHPLKEIAFFPLRRKRGFGIMVVLNLSAAQMWFCEFPQAARPGSQTARKRGFATTSNQERTTQ